MDSFPGMNRAFKHSTNIFNRVDVGELGKPFQNFVLGWSVYQRHNNMLLMLDKPCSQTPALTSYSHSEILIVIKEIIFI